MKRGNEIIRRRHTSGVDAYYTPAWATRALLKFTSFRGTVLEPASGNGAISKVLHEYNDFSKIVSSDIRTDFDVFGAKGIDFLDPQQYDPVSFDNIITNPPYSLAEAFLERAMSVARNNVALLLRLTFLESARRYQLFGKYPFSKLYVFSSRLTMHIAGSNKPANCGTAAYGWFVWNVKEIATCTPLCSVDWIPPDAHIHYSRSTDA